MQHDSAKKYILFLHGEYLPEDFPAYRKLIDGAVTIAVDGGLSFFIDNNLTPDILLGDFDTYPSAPGEYSGRAEVIRHPSAKDKSDGQLALELAIERGASEIRLCGFSGGETDHIVGNLLLMTHPGANSVNLTAWRPGEEARFARDTQISLDGHPGDILSIVPLDPQVELTLTGFEYSLDGKKISRGSTLPIRNVFAREQATVAIRGAALIFHRWDK